MLCYSTEKEEQRKENVKRAKILKTDEAEVFELVSLPCACNINENCHETR